MKSNGSRVILLGLVVALVAIPLVGLAADDGGESTTDSTQAVEDSGIVPAVELVEEPAPEAQADWTYRYLIPTGLALAALVIVATSVKYFTDVVRRRYRIVEE